METEDAGGAALEVHARERLGITLTQRQLQQFSRLTDILLEWNQRMNLTGITDPGQIAVKHYLDALTISTVLPGADGISLLDVGTGAGFPGLALAIAYPGLQATLLDSTRKKLRFIKHAAGALALDNVRTVHARAEDAGREQAHREAYDVVTARAVARLPTLMEYTLPLAKLGGQVIAMKGRSAFDESNQAARAIDALGGELFTLEELWLPGHQHPRFLIVVDKVQATPRRYPRAAGLPARQPLL